MKILWDKGQVIVDPIPMGQNVDAVQIADALKFGQTANGPGADVPDMGFDAFILGVYLRIADDIQLAGAVGYQRPKLVLVW